MESLSSKSTTVPLTNEEMDRLLLDAESRLHSTNSDTRLESINKPSIIIPPIQSASRPQHIIQQKSDIAKLDFSGFEVATLIDHTDTDRLVSDTYKSNQHVKSQKSRSGWHDMPEADLNSEIKRDLHLIRMRSVLDPKRHYKKDTTAMSQSFQVGTVLEGPTDTLRNRTTKKDRKRTILEEAMLSERESGYLKTRYNNIQLAKMHTKRHWKGSRYSKYAKKNGNRK